MKLKRTQRELGINPDPELYEDVRTKNGWYRKKKRKKKAVLNTVLSAYKEATQYSSPAAKRILLKLEPWLDRMPAGKVNAKLSGGLRKNYVETGKMGYELLKDLDISEQPLDKLFDKYSYRAEVKNREVIITLNMGRNRIKLTQMIHTHFWAEAILLWGDPMKIGSMRVDSAESKVYPEDMEKPVTEKLVLDLPAKKQPWMVLLKISCKMNDFTEMTPKYYAMRVVAVGE
jgi:hypothetical protein